MENFNETQLKYYDDNASDYEKKRVLGRGLTRVNRRKADIIRSCLPAVGCDRILEIGTGSGLMSYFFLQSFDGEYVALDASAEQLKLAKARISKENVKYVIGDGENPNSLSLGGVDGYFDAVIGVDIIHHLQNPVAAFSNWKSLVRDGGKCVFLETNVYNPLNLKNIGVEHEVRSFLNTQKNLEKWSRLAEWENVSVTPAPAFTPSIPKILSPIFDCIDKVSVKIPLWNKLTALWLINNTKQM